MNFLSIIMPINQFICFMLIAFTEFSIKIKYLICGMQIGFVIFYLIYFVMFVVNYKNKNKRGNNNES